MRQFELLLLLLDNPVTFTLKKLMETRPFSILYNVIRDLLLPQNQDFKTPHV